MYPLLLLLNPLQLARVLDESQPRMAALGLT
jgi:hypothetical protein